MERLVIFLAISWLAASRVGAQTWAIDFGTGGLNYQGELKVGRFTTRGMHAAWTLGVRRKMGDHGEIVLRGSQGVLAGQDADNPAYLTRRRNLHFQTRIHALSMHGHRHFYLHSEGWFSVFVEAGFSFFRVDPYTYDQQGIRYFLYPLSLEGQGLREYPMLKMPRRMNIGFPVGAGISCQLTEAMRLQLAWEACKTFTDQIDGVSGFYPKKDALREVFGNKAVELSYRADELVGEDPGFPLEGTMRGNPKTMDWYYGIQLRFVRSLNRGRAVYPPPKRLFRPRGWPYRL